MATGDGKNKNYKPKRDEKGRLLPGYSGNPGGALGLSKDLRELQKNDKIQFRKMLSDYLFGDFENVVNCGGSPMERIICSGIIKAMNGDVKAIGLVFDRVDGKVTQTINVEDGSESARQVAISRLKKLSKAEKLKLVQETFKQIEKENPDVIDAASNSKQPGTTEVPKE